MSKPLYFFEENMSFLGDFFAIPELFNSWPMNSLIIFSQPSYEISIASIGDSKVFENAAVYEYHACLLEITPVLNCSAYILALVLRCSAWAL